MFLLPMPSPSPSPSPRLNGEMVDGEKWGVGLGRGWVKLEERRKRKKEREGKGKRKIDEMIEKERHHPLQLKHPQHQCSTFNANAAIPSPPRRALNPLKRSASAVAGTRVPPGPTRERRTQNNGA